MRIESFQTASSFQTLFLFKSSINMILFMIGQLDPHMLDLNTSEQHCPIASLRGTPVISSAARLKNEMRQSGSTVKTPSEMLSRIASAGVRALLFVFLL